jgi:hypothetical protein
MIVIEDQPTVAVKPNVVVEVEYVFVDTQI